MKLKTFLVAYLFFFASSSFAQQQTEEQCKKNIEETISAIEFMTQQKGTEQKIKDLSVNDIREIQKAKGSCAAQIAINNRTMN